MRDPQRNVVSREEKRKRSEKEKKKKISLAAGVEQSTFGLPCRALTDLATEPLPDLPALIYPTDRRAGSPPDGRVDWAVGGGRISGVG